MRLPKPAIPAAVSSDAKRAPLLTVDELAEFLSVPASWVYERTRPGARDPLPLVRVGKYIRFDPDEVLQHLRARYAAGREGG